MKKETVSLALSAAILVSAVIIGVIYEMGLTSQDLPFDDSGPTPAPLPQPEMAVSATYNESVETVRIRVESGRMTAEEYDILEISQRGHEYDVNDTKLKLPGQTEVHPSGKWVDTESRGLASFPVMAGDSIIVVTVDQTDDDGDGIKGIDDNDSFLLGYGHRRGHKRKAILASWTVDNGTLTRGIECYPAHGGAGNPALTMAGFLFPRRTFLRVKRTGSAVSAGVDSGRPNPTLWRRRGV